MEWTNRYLDQREHPAGESPRTAEEAVASLVAGNKRFAALRSGLADGVNSEAERRQLESLAETVAKVGTVETQAPFCVVLGCSDARVPAEIIFDTGPNRLFVVRLAGNILGDECVGSIEFAASAFEKSVRVVAVLGHTSCGAVTAAASSYLNPKNYGEIAFSRALRAVVNQCLVAVRSAALSLEQVWGADIVADPGFPAALTELAVYLNAGINAYQIARELGDHGPPVVFGVYDLATSVVGVPDASGELAPKLSPAPARSEQLVELGLVLARSRAIAENFKGRVRVKGEAGN